MLCFNDGAFFRVKWSIYSVRGFIYSTGQRGEVTTEQVSYTEWAHDCKHEGEDGPSLFQLLEWFIWCSTGRPEGRESVGCSAHLQLSL